ncbi:hypothetical protein DMA15_03895 [Streptomyces sp. WAC 01529]|uniref:hypothetical protein n=1 Tax=Streptomyces sp. WAC 01529 TaxID=2203205 RepID=UPI000F70C455|nr:hypothetical protein [Streptomyces sp. WAC 01529]AZM51835.1 hypothetical protein DMA15_03895 [Streptomyces sp. WAC 01529]
MKELIDLLPELPEEDDWGCTPEGYGWIGELFGSGWHAISAWGSEGWDLGSWPYQIIAHCNLPGVPLYGLATYTEGDIDVQAFGSREERDAATNEIALCLWISNENGPDGLTEDMSPIPAQFCGPYRGQS